MFAYAVLDYGAVPLQRAMRRMTRARRYKKV